MSGHHCTFPACPTPATARNRTGQPTCPGHVPVVVAMTDDLGHGRHSDGVDEQ